jgi:hypothetical protein
MTLRLFIISEIDSTLFDVTVDHELDIEVIENKQACMHIFNTAVFYIDNFRLYSSVTS